MMAGDCFKAALKIMLDVVQANPGGQAWIVHGLPKGRGPDNDGLRYWHAWVECVPDPTAPLVVVLDRSNGLDLALPKAQYYRVGQLNQDWVWRFTSAEARRSMAILEHAGPWVYGHRFLAEVGS